MNIYVHSHQFILAHPWKLILLLLYRFCREFRLTFRKLSESETEIDIIDRHSVFYHFGRALSEIADHFGEKMARNDRVYHGLSTVMFFRSFTEYFNAPTSTTTEMSVGMNMFSVH